jgi:hypothetical protein
LLIEFTDLLIKAVEKGVIDRRRRSIRKDLKKKKRERGDGSGKKTYTSPRLFRLSVASSNVGALGCSFFAPNILLIFVI